MAVGLPCDAAAIKSEHGAAASAVPGILHVARAWVRCIRGAATVALVVSTLPEKARINDKIEATLEHYDAFPNVTVVGGAESVGSPPKNVFRCGGERWSTRSWTQLEVGFMSPQPKHEVSVQLVAHSHSDNVAIDVDDVSLSLEEGAATTSDGSSGVPSRCVGGGGAGVSYSNSHRCATEPAHFFYRLREKGGVPVAYEQVHAMVTLGYKSITCRKPEMDPGTNAECPHLAQAMLPHLSALDVKTHLDTLSDDELARHMGWSDANARGPGVDADVSVAVGLLREGLPEAIEKGVVRVLQGPNYNDAMGYSDYPPIGATTALALTWQAMASTNSFKIIDHFRRTCKHHADKRKATCYAWAEVSRILGCGFVPLLLQMDGWEDSVTFDGFFGSSRPTRTMGKLLYENRNTNPFEPPRIDLGFLPSSIPATMYNYFKEAEIQGGVLCASSMNEFRQGLARLPADYNTNGLKGFDGHTEVHCADPLFLPWDDSWEGTLDSLSLPKSAPAGKKCIDLNALDYDDAAGLFAHHKNDIVSETPTGGPKDEAARDDSKYSPLVLTLMISAIVTAMFFAAAGFFGFAVVSGGVSLVH